MIVTGCQRSGTKTMSAICGIHHEKTFNPKYDRSVPLEKIPSESSWMAAPFHRELQKAGHKILHVVRNPLAVINSLMGIGFFSSSGTPLEEQHKPYRDFCFKYLPGLNKLKTNLSQCVFYYVYWNRQLFKYPRIRIEDIAVCPVLNQRPRATLTWRNVEDDVSPMLYELIAIMNTEYGYGELADEFPCTA